MQIAEQQRKEPKGYRGMVMEGGIARRYAVQRRSGNQPEQVRRQAAQLTAGLPAGSSVLEVAPGPGYLSVEIARLGFTVTALDISRTFVEITGDNAREAGVEVTVRLGDVARMPFEAASFDRVVCQAAFKNFSRPVAALDEIHRVLRPGGQAIIQDMTANATRAAIAGEVRGMALGLVGSFMTRAILARLRRRAYSPEAFERLAARSAFGTCRIAAGGIGLEVRLQKAA
jgi:ubiquinone/menaquinone biosynthesis C-methylase UbiE